MGSEDEKFNSLLADKRHKELKTSMNTIASAILTTDKSEVILQAIEKQTLATRGLAEAIKKIPQPEINVPDNQEIILSSVEKIALTITNSQAELTAAIRDQIAESQRLKEYECSFNYHYGNITSSTIKQTK